MQSPGKTEQCKELISNADVELDDGKLEDDQIQSSLPFYLEHLFGQRVGGSSQLLADSTSPPPSGPILDSQGFLTSIENATSSRSVISDTPALVDLSSLPLFTTEEPVPEVDIHIPEVGLTNSPVLFPSPDPVNTTQTNTQDLRNPLTGQKAQNSTDIVVSDIPKARVKLQNTDNAGNKASSHFKTPKVPLADVNKTKRGKKRKLSTGKDEYVCPPAATSLKGCSLKQGTVCVLAIVVQGDWLVGIYSI